MVPALLSTLTVVSSLLAHTAAQTYQRLGGCPTLGCVFPPDQYVHSSTSQLSEILWLTRPSRTDFLAGQYFDVRLEVHAPVNGSQANGGVPDPNFTFTIAKNGKTQNAALYFGVQEPPLERWNFTWYEGTLTRENRLSHLLFVLTKPM